MPKLWKELPAEPIISDFGGNPFNPHSATDLVRVHGRTRKHLRDAICSECKNEPGVYGMLDADGGALASCDQLLIHVSLDTRRSSPPAPHVEARMRELAAGHADLVRQAG